MNTFNISWERRQQVSVEIEAESTEEAYQKWSNGEHVDNVDVDDEDILSNYVDIDGESYYLDHFGKIRSGS
nr:hypothetical protein [Enterococcus innesii]